LNTLNLCSSLFVRYQVSYSYKTTGKITIFVHFNHVSPSNSKYD